MVLQITIHDFFALGRGEFNEGKQVLFAHGLHVACVEHQARCAAVEQNGESRENLHGSEQGLRNHREGENLREGLLDAVSDLASQEGLHPHNHGDYH